MNIAYDQVTLMMLGETVKRIGCGEAMPKTHKNDWLQNRLGLKPAGRIRVQGHTRNHLVWREVDVIGAAKRWARSQKDEDQIQPIRSPGPMSGCEIELEMFHAESPLQFLPHSVVTTTHEETFTRAQVEAIVRFHSGKAVKS